MKTISIALGINGTIPANELVPLCNNDLCLGKSPKLKMSQKVEKVHNFLDHPPIPRPLPPTIWTFFNF